MARAKRFSRSGETTTAPSETATETAGWRARFSVPPFPFTITSFEATDTSVPAGIFIGSFPVRLIVLKLPDLEQRFASDLLFSGFFIRLHALGSREYEGSVAIADRHYFACAFIDPAAGLRNAFNAEYRVISRLVVFKCDVECFPRLFSFFLEGLHVAGVLQFFGYRVFERRMRHGNACSLDGAGVLEAYHEISYRIVCHNGYQEDFLIPGIFPSRAS